MRNDMKDVIIDVYRRGGRMRYSRPKLNDLESLPERESMTERLGGWGREQADRLNPLTNYLDKQVGRKWADVYSEICKNADPRGIRGWHMREHVKQMVIPETELVALLGHQWRHHYWEFYEDTEGVLRKHSGGRIKWPKPKPNADECEIAGKPYSRINGCWFEACYQQVMESYTVYNWGTKEHDIHFREKRIQVGRRQLNKKELKRLGLSNAPGWKWYERST